MSHRGAGPRAVDLLIVATYVYMCAMPSFTSSLPLESFGKKKT